MAKLKERGRQALAVGAGVMLIGTLTAGSALATSSYDEYDWDYYYSYDCGDYKYSSYYKYGYWYEKHPDRPDTNPPVENPDLPGLEDLPLDELLDIIQDLIDAGLLPEGFELPDGVTNPGAIADAIRDAIVVPEGASPEDVEGAIRDAIGGVVGGGTAPTGSSPLSAAADDGAGQVDESAGTATPPPAVVKDEENGQDTASEKPAAPVEKPANEQNVVPESAPSAPVVTENVEGTSAVTSLSDDPDYKDEDDKHKEGYYKYGEKKYSYTSYKCYENKEKKHRWYDHREPGKVTATAVRSVPKGGVDTGN